MIATVSDYCLIVLALSALAALYRIIRGPSIADRVAATDLLTSAIMAIVVVSGLCAGSRDYIDIVIALAIIGFFGSVALARYLIGGRPID